MSRCTEVSGVGGTKTVRFVAEPSEYQLTSGEFSQELLELVDRDAIIVLDFSGVTRVLTRMLSDLLMLRKSVLFHNGQLRFTGMNESLHDVFKLVRLDRILDISAR